MAFQLFNEVRRSFTPKVSIRQRGQIGFNDALCRSLKLREYKGAQLFFDEGEKKIGIRFIKDKDAAGFIALRHRATGADLSAKSFFDKYGILPKKSMRFDIKKEPVEGIGELLVLDLSLRWKELSK